MATYNIKVGEKLRLAATLEDSSGKNIKGTATWQSSSTATATVTPANQKTQADPITGTTTSYTDPANAQTHKATVLGVAAGTTTITVTNGIVSTTATVVVSDGSTIASISLRPA